MCADRYVSWVGKTVLIGAPLKDTPLKLNGGGERVGDRLGVGENTAGALPSPMLAGNGMT